MQFSSVAPLYMPLSTSKLSSEQLAQYYSALNMTSIVSITDRSGRITYVNKLFEEISGYRRCELLGQSHNVIRHPDMPDEVFRDLWKTIKAKQIWTGLIKNQRKDGNSYYVKTSIIPILTSEGNIKEYLSIRNDVTRIIKARRTIQRQTTDTLTGLPNRVRLLKDLSNGDYQLVALLDVRNFKMLNDYWGVESGNEIIQQLANNISSAAAMIKIRVYAMNGALFALLPEGTISLEDFYQDCQRLRLTLASNPIQLQEHPIDIPVTMAIGYSSKTPLAYAESALQEAKQCYWRDEVPVKDDGSDPADNFHIIEHVRTLLDNDSLKPMLQPVVAAAEPSRVVFYEALARFDSEAETWSPAEVLPLLKRTHYYQKLTVTMMKRALAIAREHHVRVSVNLSIHDILNRETANMLLDMLTTGNGNQIIVELTESEAITDFEPVKAFVERLKNLDVMFAIDDFGNGYSNFAYLTELKPDIIKIDGSIIKNIEHNRHHVQVLKSIIFMASQLGIQTVAEYVESASRLTLLQELDIDMVQGFFIGRPALKPAQF
ncbi:Aerotaxis receptor [Saliniradius amylolyticus]|uniref:Aerotaxis receptor n=1 Tax=Saliniradius amylolyticus TaxID=2183582 RepID=A0A2S2E1N7_9ALTE|nr:GGDEF domain-containing phosphodiesterase [Saliniradius amylolyticus]AWL11553.1 Aerotaxis receptor [Saliniradius amylolyticus]